MKSPPPCGIAVPSGHRMRPLCRLGFMEIFHKILHAAVESHASDIHLKIGHPVAVRINRQLLAVDAPEPTDVWLEKVLSHVVPKHLRPSLEKDREPEDPHSVPSLRPSRHNLYHHDAKPA